MKQLRRFGPIALAAMIAGAVACGSDSTGTGPQAASVTGIAGDSQVGPTGSPLDFPLSMTLLGSNGQPIQGVSVAWSAVPANGASFNPQPSVSDVNGMVATTVTMGSVRDTIVINATVPGVAQPVAYHALAVDPCTFSRSYTVGATANGVLTTTDCQLGGPYYTDFYDLTIGAQARITVTMSASTFDAWLDAYRGSGPSMAGNNNIDNTTTNAGLELILAPGTYFLAPNSFHANSTGAYTLSSAVRAQTLSGCAEAWVSANVTITDSLATTDCIDSVGTGVYYDQIGIIAFPGDTLRFTQRSSAFNAQLTLYRIDQAGATQVASNDDSSATTTDAFIDYATIGTVGAVYVLSIGSPDTAAAGAYTLIVGGSASLGASPMLARGLRRVGRKTLVALQGLPKSVHWR